MYSFIADILDCTYCACVTAIVFTMGTKFLIKEKIVSGTRSEDSMTLRLSSLPVLARK